MKLQKICLILLTAALLAINTTSAFAQYDESELYENADAKSVAESSSDSNDIAGSWRATVTPEGGMPFEALLTFSEGGGVIGSAQGDILLDAPPGVPPSATAVHGSWKRMAKRNFLFTVRQIFYGADGSNQGGNKVRNSVVLNPNGTQINGQFQFDLYDADGIVVFSGNGSIQAVRIQIEPLTP